MQVLIGEKRLVKASTCRLLVKDAAPGWCYAKRGSESIYIARASYGRRLQMEENETENDKPKDPSLRRNWLVRALLIRKSQSSLGLTASIKRFKIRCAYPRLNSPTVPSRLQTGRARSD